MSEPRTTVGPSARSQASDAAAYVNGITMITDAGYVSAGVTGSFGPAKEAVDFLVSL